MSLTSNVLRSWTLQAAPMFLCCVSLMPSLASSLTSEHMTSKDPILCTFRLLISTKVIGILIALTKRGTSNAVSRCLCITWQPVGEILKLPLKNTKWTNLGHLYGATEIAIAVDYSCIIILVAKVTITHVYTTKIILHGSLCCVIFKL